MSGGERRLPLLKKHCSEFFVGRGEVEGGSQPIAGIQPRPFHLEAGLERSSPQYEATGSPARTTLRNLGKGSVRPGEQTGVRALTRVSLNVPTADVDSRRVARRITYFGKMASTRAVRTSR